MVGVMGGPFGPLDSALEQPEPWVRLGELGHPHPGRAGQLPAALLAPSALHLEFLVHFQHGFLHAL